MHQIAVLHSKCQNPSNLSVRSFSSFLRAAVRNVFDQFMSFDKTINQEKLWSSFHVVRSSYTFQKRWETFLNENDMDNCQMFYQMVTTLVFKEYIKLN